MSEPEPNTAPSPQTAIVLARATMAGQLRDVVLDVMIHAKENTLPWNMWKEEEQQRLIDRVNETVEEATRQAVEIIVADDRPTITCSIDQFVVKDEIKVVLKSPVNDGALDILAGLRSKAVLLTYADASDYLGATYRGPEKLQREMFPGEDEPGESDKPVFDQTKAGRRGRRSKGEEDAT